MGDQPKPENPPVTAWTYLNLALNAAIILLCMFLLYHVQDISKRLAETEQTVSALSQTVNTVESYVRESAPPK